MGGQTGLDIFLLEDFPLEGVSLGLLSLNPIDLARVVVLLQMDVSALMGYTGAMMKDLLGTGSGVAFAAAVLAGWIAVPLSSAVWVFRRKDLQQSVGLRPPKASIAAYADSRSKLNCDYRATGRPLLRLTPKSDRLLAQPIACPRLSVRGLCLQARRSRWPQGR